ncbi:tyrosine-protein kinase Fer isoform X3 [Agelaius phoeniceus]|uniref:tyrosine-protein kinase Fer isoform X3 n=1 Tax=Agelaius phoeniceus TaxID=39638 RepID=UPI004054B4B1
MGFGGDLKYSHDALLKLQDWELRLLETVKKFMVMRVKSDKEYASTLQNLCNQVDKESACQLDYISNVSKSWLLVVQQTEQLSKIMKTHAEDLNSGPLHRLTMMIKDKQQVKKSFVGVHQQIEAEMYKVTKTELEKLKSSYRQLIKEVNSAKEKYKEAVAKVLVAFLQWMFLKSEIAQMDSGLTCILTAAYLPVNYYCCYSGISISSCQCNTSNLCQLCLKEENKSFCTQGVMCLICMDFDAC